MPVTWVDGVTPVNAVNMEILDTDIAARQVSSEKGAANGYAPLDAGSKVPLANLPPVSGVDYIGNWGAGTAYKRGDVVRYNGQDYLAVNDSTGVTPPAAYVAPNSTGYGTSLPASPFDGQEYVLVDSLTAPTYTWRFRFNSGSSSAYKWEFVGGTPVRLENGGGPSITSTTYVDLTTPVSITVARAGDYSFRFGGSIYNSATSGSVYLALYKNAAASDADSVSIQNVPTINNVFSLAKETSATIAAAGGIAKLQARVSGGTGVYAQCFLYVTPLRVS